LPEWGQYIVPIDDLPLEGLSSLRVRFDLMGAGDVWIDDVQIYNLAFTRWELRELYKLLHSADALLEIGQIGDCLHQLEGYWPRFLEENVPLQPNAVPAATPADTLATQPRPAEQKPPERSGFLNRIKNIVPESLRF
jgi:hypothetical protein